MLIAFSTVSQPRALDRYIP